MTRSAVLPLSRQRILACAVEVADHDGFEAASLRRVATELGVHVTSLYNHVPTKEALLDGMLEELFAGADLPRGEQDWHEWVRRFIHGIAAMAAAHPGASAVLLRRPVQGPQATATFEVGLEAFRQAGMSVVESYTAVKSIALSVLGCCLEAAAAAAGSDLQTDVEDLSWQDFPVLHEVTAVVTDLDIVSDLTELLVAGFEHRIAALG